ncbi:MAG: tRNA pseudouridine(55) synthase TruB [Vicinamibacterales bacterium]
MGDLDGLLVVDKPAGPTSHDVVARVRRLLGERRIGHAGTLDPLATGVLVLVVGRATRLAQFMSGDEKAYDATVRLGVATDTYDADGTPVGDPYTGPWPGRDLVTAALDGFLGTHLQAPPRYSAKKIAGQRSYALARRAARAAGPPGSSAALVSGPPENSEARAEASLESSAAPAAAPAPAPVPVTLRSCAVGRYGDGLLELSIACSAGFYVRTLAHELGQRLGTGAHLAALRRTRSGAASLAQAVPLAEIEADPERARAALVPMAGMLPDLPAVVLTEAEVQRVAHGGTIVLDDAGRVRAGDVPAGLASAGSGSPPASASKAVRLVAPSGALLAIATPVGPPGTLHPSVVLM